MADQYQTPTYEDVYNAQMDIALRPQHVELLCEWFWPAILFYNITSEYNKTTPLPNPDRIFILETTKWIIHEHSDYVLLGIGEERFNEYGYRKLFIDAINETLDNVISKKEWLTTVAEGYVERLEACAWVLMDQHPKVEAPVFAPYLMAEQMKAQVKACTDAAEVLAAHYYASHKK